LADADQSGPAQLEQLMRNPKEASIQLGGGQAEAMFAQAYHTNFQTTELCSRARGALLTGGGSVGCSSGITSRPKS
jgi:hypothetical protein